MFAPQVAARGVPVAEFNMENTPATQRFKYVLMYCHKVRYITYIQDTDTYNFFFVSGSTSMAPVGPRCPLRWNAMRVSRVKNESWTSAAHRPDRQTLEDFIYQ